MRHTGIVLAVVAAFVAATGCSKSSSSTPQPSRILVTASTASAVADGASVIAIHADGDAQGPFRVVTTRGTFDGGVTTATFDVLPFNVILHSCDANVTASCAGVAQVSVVGANLATGDVVVVFTAPAPACSSGLSLCSSACVNTQTDPANCGGCGSACGATQTCQQGICQSGTGGGGGGGTTTYVVTATSSAATIPADGKATAVISARVSGTGAAGRVVDFALSGATGASLSQASATTDANGGASVTLTSSSAGGNAVVTVTDRGSGASATATVSMPQLGQVKAASEQYQIQGVRFSGYQEQNQLVFQLLDAAGQNYPAGLTVTFSHRSLGGSFIGATPTCAAGTGVCTATGVTDASGKATVTLTSGRVAGLVSVSATATAAGVTATGAMDGVAIMGAKASGAHVTIDCTPKNVPALSANDCSFSHYTGAGNIVTCRATFADRFNNVLGVSTPATFASEAGAAGPPTSTPQFTPGGSASQGLGIATDYINVTGGALPTDVSPFTGEASLTYLDSCGMLTHNPRDGLSTVIVMARGEEGFVDLNGNGAYDMGEPFIDMGEPYVDANDNGKWDSGEPFLDVNDDGTYDGPNGVWDADTVIWAQTRILYTDVPKVSTAAGDEELSRFLASGDVPPAPTPTRQFTVVGSPGPNTSAAFGLEFMDGNLNPPASSATYAIATAGTGVVTPSFTQAPAGTDDLGLTFTQQYCDDPTSPSSCASTCEGRGPNGACYVVTNVGGCTLPARDTCAGFSYGRPARAQVLGTCTAASATDTVIATATVAGLSVDVPLAGTCSACSAGLSLCSAACVDTQTDPANCGGCGNVCGGTQTCQAGVCQGGGGGGGGGVPVLGVVASATRIPADGLARSQVTATVTLNGAPVAGHTITFAQAGSAATLDRASATTDSSGKASAWLTSDAAGGTATVTVTDTTASPTLSASVQVDMPRLGFVNVASQQFQVQGVESSGYQEVNQLTFQLLDPTGLPYPAGLRVDFGHERLGGSFIGDAGSCLVGPPATCSATGVTDASGQVTVYLTSGQVAGVVSVTATATAGGQTRTGAATNLAIVGAKASGAHITLDCSPRNVPALTDDDCSYSHYAAQGNVVTCKATLADRFNNALGKATVTTFQSEAGSVGPPASTPQYDATQPPTGQANLGVATDYINVYGGKLPVDVAAFAGESSVQYPDACGTKTHNPRDGLATVIAMANGEEGYVDLNGNGRYDLGEPFIDVGEPYVDVNDNGQFDPGEPFTDVNGNRAYDGPNKQWDANTVIWAETRIVYTGHPVRLAAPLGGEAGTRFYDSGTPPDATPVPTLAVLGKTTGPSSQFVNVFFTDGNYNAASSFASVGIEGGDGLDASYLFTPAPLDTLGMAVSQQYCDDPSSPTSCANVCEGKGPNGACYVVTNVGTCDLPGRATCTGFGYGDRLRVGVKGTCSDPSSGEITATSTLNGYTSRFTLAGTCTP